MNQEKTEPEEFTKKFIDYFLRLSFSFINKHTQDYFYEFIALALSDDKNEFTVEQAKKIKLKDAMRIFNTILFDEDAQEFIRDAFFSPSEGGWGLIDAYEFFAHEYQLSRKEFLRLPYVLMKKW